MRALVQLLLLPFPWLVRRPLLCLLLGFKIAPTAWIGCSILNVRRLELGEGAHIGHLTYAKGLDLIRLDEAAILGNLNWITGYPANDRRFFSHVEDRKVYLHIARHAAITSRHLIDCTAGVEVGAFAIVAGWQSQIVTHSIEFDQSRQDAEAIKIGEYSFIGSRSILLKGSHFPARSILGAGSTFGLKGDHPSGLYNGVPAQFVREIDASKGFFHRERGLVT